jgi:hypothetical protein
VDTSDKAHVDFLAVLPRQLEPKSLMQGNVPCAVAGVVGCPHAQTLDTMRRDRKHLVSTEVEKRMAAVKSSRTVSRGCRNVLYCV